MQLHTLISLLFTLAISMYMYTYLCQVIDMNCCWYHPTLCIGKRHCHCAWKYQQRVENECGQQEAVQMVNQRYNHQCLTPAKQQAKQQLPEQCTPLTVDALKMMLHHISVATQTANTYWEGCPHPCFSSSILPGTNTTIVSVSYGNGKNVATIWEVSICYLQRTQKQIM